MKKRDTFFAFRLFFFLLMSLVLVQKATAQATLSVQGTVQKSTGAAVDDGEYSLTFKLYTTDTGGTPVWSETQDAVSIIGGVYSVTLGAVSPLTAAFDQPYYLGITVGSGAELTPRARLTSSPYALSLIGQDNKFPSTGPIGAGTASPTAGYQLHVKSASGDGKLLVEGSGNAKVDLKSGSNSVSLTYNGSKITVPGTVDMPGTVNIPGTANVGTLNTTNFSPANMAISSKLAVGQSDVDATYSLKVAGSSLFTGYLEITGQQTGLTSVYGGGSYIGRYCYNGLCGGFTGPFTASIRSGGSIYLGGDLYVNSDARIKKDIKTASTEADLALLRKLRVANYRFKDEIRKGDSFTNGLIAQEVKALFPQAVTYSSDYLPSVYALTSDLDLKNGQLEITMNENHGLAAGDEVKLIMPDDSELRTQVLAAASARAFSIKWDVPAVPERIFVYGKKVNDFHSVDYDRIFMLNVSATQELARRVEQLEAENTALRQHNERLQQQNEGLRTDVNDIYKRLLNLEKRTGGHLEK